LGFRHRVGRGVLDPGPPGHASVGIRSGLNTARRFEGQSGPRLRDGVRSALLPFRLKSSLEPTSGRHFGSPSRPFRQIRRWRGHLLLSWRRSSRRRTDCLPQQQPVSQRPRRDDINVLLLRLLYFRGIVPALSLLAFLLHGSPPPLIKSIERVPSSSGGT
jgi:hypothetical protein